MRVRDLGADNTDMQKKVLIFSLAYYPRFVSGAEAAIREITDRIDSSEIEFHMVTLRFDTSDPKQEKIGRVVVHRVGFGSSYLSKICFAPLAAYRARRVHRETPFDGVWAMMTYMLLPVMVLRLIGVRLPYALTLQDGDPYEKVFKRWFMRPFVPLLDRGFKRATVVQVISEYLGTWPRERGYTGMVEVIHNGADPRDVANNVTNKEVQELWHSLGKQPGDIYLINTARLEHQKAFDIVIRALSELPPHIKLLIVGSGTEESSLRTLVTELNLSSRVIFVGMVDRDRASVYRKAADIFVGPSRSEGLGIAFLSAMASGLPVIATQEGGLAEFIWGSGDALGREQTAFVVPKDDPVAIKEAVEYILAHPDLVEEITSRARAMVQKDYDWDTIVNEMNVRVFAHLGNTSLHSRAL